VRIASFLVHKAASSINSITQLKDYVEIGFPVELTDDKLRTPLHKAALNRSPEGVRILLNQGRAKVATMDSDRRTPLHLAVQGAAELDVPDKRSAKQEYDVSDKKKIEEQELWRDIIEQLTGEWDVLDIEDCEEKTASEYAKDKRWILDALDTTGLRESQATTKSETLKRPKDGPKKDACDNVRTRLVQIWTEGEYGKRYNKCRNGSPTVSTLIYGHKKSAKAIREEMRDDLVCCWVHIPANNVSRHPD